MENRIIEITINGETYPCRLTMGAMVRFRELTGYEIHQCTDSSRDMCAYLWACAVSASKREGKAFTMPFMEFCDALDPQDVIDCWTKLQEQLNASQDNEEAEGEEKKSR